MDEAHVFEEGDVVMMKSGGPQMVVIGYLENSDTVVCEWFNYGTKVPTIAHAVLHEARLKLC